MKNKGLWMGIVMILMLFTGCCTTYPGESYVSADEETYIYAQPKLEEWAKFKKEQGDDEWEMIVKNKGISWKARVERAKKAGKNDE